MPPSTLDTHRPLYHFTPPKNWMNDPNGLIQWNGVYHLFYQHNPLEPVWGNMTWGHATSRDLLRWTHRPQALHPDSPYDRDGVFSGCIVDDGGVATAIYTGVQPETQCLAISEDLLTWTKDPTNPVISGPPSGIDVTGFRDPCVWRDGTEWVMALGSGVRGRGGAVLCYRSPDLRRWEYRGPFLESNDTALSDMWECPNLFPVGDRWALVFSPMIGRARYFTGKLDGDQFVPDPPHVGVLRSFGDDPGEVDCGGTLYAPQVFRDTQDRRIMFGWLRETRSENSARRAVWSGALSLPRVVTLTANGRLCFSPADEVRSLRRSEWSLSAGTSVAAAAALMQTLLGLQMEIGLEVRVGSDADLSLWVLCSPDGEEATRVFYSSNRQLLGIDVSRSDAARRDRAKNAPDQSEEFITPLRVEPGETLSLRVFVDGSIVEVYANGGVCLTSRAYPDYPESTGYRLGVSGSVEISRLQVWEMEPVMKTGSSA